MITSFRNVYVCFALVLPLAIFAFWKTYFGILGNLPEHITTLLHVHTLLMIIWLLMLIAQAWFIRTKRFRLHRLVGRSSYVVVPVIILTILAVFHEMFNRAPDSVPPELARLNVLGFGQVLAFGITWGLAIKYRKHTPTHVRFIISSVIAIATAIVFRVFFLWIPGFDSPDHATAGNCVVLSLLLLILIAADWRMGLKRSPYWVVLIALSVMHLGYWTFARTDGWFAFCQWYADLPLRGS
jgi:hypothetical protein